MFYKTWGTCTWYAQQPCMKCHNGGIDINIQHIHYVDIGYTQHNNNNITIFLQHNIGIYNISLRKFEVAAVGISAYSPNITCN